MITQRDMLVILLRVARRAWDPWGDVKFPEYAADFLLRNNVFCISSGVDLSEEAKKVFLERKKVVKQIGKKAGEKPA